MGDVSRLSKYPLLMSRDQFRKDPPCGLPVSRLLQSIFQSLSVRLLSSRTLDEMLLCLFYPRFWFGGSPN